MQDISNLRINRIILHNVFPPDEQGHGIAPITSQVLTILDDAGHAKLQERITSALGRGSHCIPMDIEECGDGSCFQHVCKLLDMDDPEFITQSARLARLHTKAHTSRSWPGGSLVVITSTVRSSNRRCLIIIKAERHEGFVEKEIDENVIMEYINKLLLTPHTKLYKIGVFIENNIALADNGLRNRDDFEAYVFDSNISARNSRKAARYFYNSFLGLEIPITSKDHTLQFFEWTSTFINRSPVSTEKKVDLHNALYTYMKIDQGTTVSVSTFAEAYLDHELRDVYEVFMMKMGFPSSSVIKDTTFIKDKLRKRRIRFNSDVNIIAPADQFAELVKIVESSHDSTIVRIAGQLKDQDS